MCGNILVYREKIGDLNPPPPARQQFLEKILILSHRSLGPIRRCSFVVFFKTPARP